jgi:hypothetical protein
MPVGGTVRGKIPRHTLMRTSNETIPGPGPDGASTACLERERIEEEIHWKSQQEERPEENWK